MLIEGKVLVDHVVVAIEVFSKLKKYCVLLLLSKRNQSRERKSEVRIGSE